MGKVISCTIVTKPEQLNQVEGGPFHIILGPNLRIKKNNKQLKKNKLRKSK